MPGFGVKNKISMFEAILSLYPF